MLQEDDSVRSREIEAQAPDTCGEQHDRDASVLIEALHYWEAL